MVTVQSPPPTIDDRAAAEEHQDERPDHLGGELLLDGGVRPWPYAPLEWRPRGRRSSTVARSGPALPRLSRVRRWTPSDDVRYLDVKEFSRMPQPDAQPRSRRAWPRSSTRTPTRRRCWRRTPSSRSSQAYAAKAGVEVETRDISLAARILAQFPDRLTDEQRRRRARRARRAGQDARGQHHQAAQRLRLHPAAQGRDQGAAGAGLRPPGLPGEPADRRGEGRRREVRQGQGLRGQPGAARGQLRPPRAASVKNYAKTHPHRMGAWSRRLQDQRRDHGQGRLPLQREVRRASRPTTP